MTYQPVFIIGAPRSGTNILRDCLSASAAIATWPCDEINYIWKYGNAKYPTDQVKLFHLTPKIESYIKEAFSKLAKQSNSRFVLEKTCANCLRVDYLKAIFPGAKYIYIYRDGVDCSASALKRWKAEFDLNYTLKKVKYVPVSDLPYYFFRFLNNRIFKIFSEEKRLAYWGPNFDGMSELLKQHDASIISAHQWEKCNSMALDSLEGVNQDNVQRINYRDLANQPQKVIENITRFLELSADESESILSYAKEHVRRSSLARGYKEFSEDRLKQINLIIKNTMQRLDLGRGDE